MKKLYLGTKKTSSPDTVHFPIIETVCRDLNDITISHYFNDLNEYTHIIFTSKNCVRHFLDALSYYQLDFPSQAKILSIGTATADALPHPSTIALPETQEGIIHLLRYIPSDSYLFYPRSSLARRNLEHYLMRRKLRHQVCDLYDTRVIQHKDLPNLEQFNEIIFTSPSTVQAFIELFGSLPKKKILTPIGPVTEKELLFLT